LYEPGSWQRFQTTFFYQSFQFAFVLIVLYSHGTLTVKVTLIVTQTGKSCHELFDADTEFDAMGWRAACLQTGNV
jgi:hypothetical protein